jgi:acyl-coenzyme A synthetase/AMP-(fatty) acid ligase
MNLIDPILRHCRINAEQPAICAPGTQFDVITYAQLEYMMNNIIRAMLSLGFQPGDVVGVRVQDDVFHVALILALIRMGVIAVSISGATPSPEINATAIITDAPDADAGGKHVVRANPEWVKGSAKAVVDPRLIKATGNEICRIFLTSGSTGRPKGVALSHRNLIERNVRINYSFGGRWSEHSRIYCDLGIASEPAFRFVLYMLMRGGMVMFPGRNAVSTEQSLDLFRVQSMVTSPRGLAEHLKFYEHNNIPCSLDHILSVGGILPGELLQRVWGRMCPNIFSDYGATEVGSVASADFRNINQISGRVGYVVPPASAEAVDEGGAPVAEGAEGIIRLRTPYMADGYVGHPEASAKFFRDGWFYPGDFGNVAPDGLLVITGRLETRLNVGGDKVDPERIEEVVKNFREVNDAAVLTVPNALGLEDVYALIQTDGYVDDDALRTHCLSRLGRNFTPVRFIAVDRIPRNDAGKIQRGQLLELARRKLS